MKQIYIYFILISNQNKNLGQTEQNILPKYRLQKMLFGKAINQQNTLLTMEDDSSLQD